VTGRSFEALRRYWYRKAGVEDIEPGDLLIHERGSRAADAQDIAFAGEMADAARDILRHPALTPRQRAIWRLHVQDSTYAEIAKKVGCSFRDVSASLDAVQALMLKPTMEEQTMGKRKGPGRPPTMHVAAADGMTVCGRKAVKGRLTTPDKSNCKDGCATGNAAARPAKSARAAKPPRNKPAATEAPPAPMFVIPPEAPELPAFVDLETSVDLAGMNAHRKIAEISLKPALTSNDVEDNKRACDTLLAIRASEMKVLRDPRRTAPADDAEVQAKIDAAAKPAAPAETPQ